ncbi:unnamed protein product [Rotaria sp. Silwood1]|nr:unnamed protein product [Rotaria sp. Silwood1]CAF1524418.1 unnamed protein product [Rotaria sp. Silwood1]
MDNNTLTSTTDIDSFVDSQPMNDAELTKFHESILQMFRSEKIGPKMHLILYLLIIYLLYLKQQDDNDLSLSTDVNTTTQSSQLLTPTSLISSSSTINHANTPIRSRTNSITSNSSILANAANLLTDAPNEYSYLDSTKVNAFINEINNNNNTKLDDIIISPSKLIRKRRLSIEYPFPFLVEQAKKQRMIPKKLREQLLKHNLLLRPPSPEYEFLPFDNTNDLTNNINDFILPNSSNNNLNDLIISNSSLILKRQRAIDFRHLQTNMKQIIFKHFETNKNIFFSEVYSTIHQDDNQQISSSDIGICFAALLNNSVRYQFILESNEIQDDIHISSPIFNNNNNN